MRGAVLGILLLSCTVAASSAGAAPPAPESALSSPRDLYKRCLRLLKLIRVEASASEKNTALLRATLNELAAENNIAPDPKVTSRLRLAEANLALLAAGQPLPPPTSDETDAEDLSDANSYAGPETGQRAGIAREQIVLAAAAEIGGMVFDGTLGHGGGSAVGAPVPSAVSDLGPYLSLKDGNARKAFLLGVSKDLLAQLKLPDEKGDRAEYLAWRLGNFLSSHPDRKEFIALRMHVEPDETLHLSYTLRDGRRVDQELGKVVDWSTPKYAQKAKGGSTGKKKSSNSSKPKKGGGDGADSPSGGSKKHDRPGHSGAGRSSGGRAGSEGGGGNGGHAGRHGHAKDSHGVGTGRFDGGGRVAGGSPGASSGGRSGHERAGRFISGDNGSADPRASAAKGSKTIRGTSIPIPKDYVSRGGSPRLSAGKDASSGDRGGGEFGGQTRLKASASSVKAHGGGSPDAGSAPVPGAPLFAAKGGQVAAATPPSQAAAGSPRPPLTVDDGLRDAVAAHAAETQNVPAVVSPKSSSETPAQPEPASSPWPLASAVTGAFLVAAASFLRLTHGAAS